MLDKKKQCRAYLNFCRLIFSKYVLYDKVVKISPFFFFLNGFGIALLETSNSVINCIITEPECGLPNGKKNIKFHKLLLMFCTLFKR